jgi:hypothetical protein
MLWKILILFIILILICITYYQIYKKYIENYTDINNFKIEEFQNNRENFLFVNDSQLYISPEQKELPTEIKYQIPVSANNLTDEQLQSIDTDVLRNTRTLKNFSMTDELDFYQMYNILKKQKNKEYIIKYNTSEIKKKSNIIESEKLISLNSGAINKTDLELFMRIKLELISAFNELIIKSGYYVQYHPYQFFKIINSNLISETNDNKTNKTNYVFTLTIAREYKYQQFTIYYDIDLQKTSGNSNEYKLIINKVELIGIPIPQTIEFHENRKTTDKVDLTKFMTTPTSFLTSEQIQENELTNLIEDDRNREIDKKAQAKDYYYRDQVSDSALFDVKPVGDKSKIFQDPNMKFIDVNEKSDIERTLLDNSSVSNKIEEKIMNIARDQQFKNHRCFALVDGESIYLPAYNNPIFCKSYHPEVNQNGIWDAPCQVNSDCPFYQANKNYPNEFGKCIKDTGKCEMPMGVIPLGFTKYGKIEPICYNCDVNSTDSRCCGKQFDDIKSGKAKYNSPDYVFKDDEHKRRHYKNELLNMNLEVNPSL